VNSPALDVLERFVDILELLNSQLGTGGITTERLITEHFEEVDKDDTV
jgi:hypothetical protein